MAELDFNREVRAVLRAQGFQALHIREADIPGVFDILAWGLGFMFWLELKTNSGVRPAQREFGRTQWQVDRNAYFLRLDDENTLLIAAGDNEDNVLAEVLWVTHAHMLANVLIHLKTGEYGG